MKAELICDSADELELKISELQKKFPDVTAKDNDERLALYAYLRTRRSQIGYPLRIVHDDRPDFILYHDSSEIGLEVAKLTTEPYEQGSNIMRGAHAEASISTTKLLTNQKLAKSEILSAQLAQEALPSPTEPSKSLESTWQDRLIALIRAKTAKAERFSTARIHLSILDRLSFNAAESFERTANLKLKLQKTLSLSNKIELILIATDPRQRGAIIEKIGG